jgi:organic hydroperoxide reductase OsmC/OhrA
MGRTALMPDHRYTVDVTWTGNRGPGTVDYRSYDRDTETRAADKAPIAGSSDPAFRGDPTRYNPEELLVASLSQCHLLWYLHLCARDGIIVSSYEDHAVGTMTEDADGGGRFASVVLRPEVEVLEEAMADRARSLHKEAARLCFIANSVNFPVSHEPVIAVSRRSTG